VHMVVSCLYVLIVNFQLSTYCRLPWSQPSMISTFHDLNLPYCRLPHCRLPHCRLPHCRLPYCLFSYCPYDPLLGILSSSIFSTSVLLTRYCRLPCVHTYCSLPQCRLIFLLLKPSCASCSILDSSESGQCGIWIFASNATPL
jgi:hypothetical protein